MNLKLEQTYIANLAVDLFDPEKVRITSNKGVLIRAENTYHIMPTKYGYRLSVVNNYEGLRKMADSIALKTSIRESNGFLIIRVKDVSDLLKVIKKSEEIIH